MNSKRAKKRNREVDYLRTSGVASNELLAQPVRVTRSQWRRSITERRDQPSDTDTDKNCLQSSYPETQNTSRSSSRTASPVFGSKGPEKVEGCVANGEVSHRPSRESRSPEPKRLNSSSANCDTKGKQRNSSQASSWDISPEVLAQNFERKNSNCARSHLDKGKSRTYRKTTLSGSCNFTTEEEQKLSSKIPIVLNSIDSKEPSSVTVKQRVTNTFGKLTSKDLLSPKPINSTSKVAGKKRVRSLSKTQYSAVKREKKDNSSSIDKSEVKADFSKTNKTGGRLSRARTSQVQTTGERRSTTGSCASNR